MNNTWKHKLFIPRTIDGKNVNDQFDFVRGLCEYVRKREKRLLGFTILGGTLKGYTTTNSDIDLAPVCRDVGRILSNTNDFQHQLYSLSGEYVAMRKNEDLPVFDFEFPGIARVNAFGNENNIFNSLIINPDIACLLLFPGVGKNLDWFRWKVKVRIKLMTSKQQHKYGKSWLYWMKFASNCGNKPLERGFIDNEELYKERRFHMLCDRFERLYGVDVRAFENK